ncbi:MAG: iron ABC transporter permease [Rhodococcus sp.]|nr:iron ABC transporter permease [Rhodococcus sp. (in: high G+C Gram-positive bacteria)]
MTTTRPPEIPAAVTAPPGPSLPVRRAGAELFDLLLLAVPVLIGVLLVDTLGEANGGGQTDRLVFGGAAALVAAGFLLWNRGIREGRTGTSLGKQWTGVLTRDPDTDGPVGTLRALFRVRTQVVTAREAALDGFAPRPPDTSVAAIRRRRLGGLAVLLILLVLVLLASVAIGARPMTFAEVYHALVVNDGAETDVIVQSLRVPRTLLGLVVGIALGVAGALIQGHTRNPLADAGLLGINGGAALLVVLSIYLFGTSTPIEYLWFSFAGSLLASVVVFGFASIGNGGSSPLSLALAGAAVAFFLQAMVQTIVLLDQTSLDGFRFWVVGSVAGRGFDVFWQVLPFIVAGLVIALASTPGLNVLSLGDDVARSLGTNIALTRVIGITVITILTGAATAACGPIAFVGLIVPHIARAITGPDYRWLVPYAGLLGGVLLVLADVIGRIVVRPGELQVGIVLALVGAPFFIALVRRRKLVSL